MKVIKAVAAAMVFGAVALGVGVTTAHRAAAEGCGDGFQSEWWEENGHEWWDDCNGPPPWGWREPPDNEWYGAPPWENPHEIDYFGHRVTPLWDAGRNSWGFYSASS